MRSTITGLSMDVASGGGVRVRGPLSSGAVCLVVSLIVGEVRESGRFGAF